jgi:hypothetical protein
MDKEIKKVKEKLERLDVENFVHQPISSLFEQKTRLEQIIIYKEYYQRALAAAEKDLEYYGRLYNKVSTQYSKYYKSDKGLDAELKQVLKSRTKDYKRAQNAASDAKTNLDDYSSVVEDSILKLNLLNIEINRRMQNSTDEELEKIKYLKRQKQLTNSGNSSKRVNLDVMDDVGAMYRS